MPGKCLHPAMPTGLTPQPRLASHKQACCYRVEMVDVSHHAPHGRKPQHCGRWRDRTTLKGTRVNATLCGRLCSDGCEYLQRFVDRNKQGPHVFPGLQVLSTSHASTLQTRMLGKKSCLHEPQIPAGHSEHCGHRAGDEAGQPQPHGLGFPGRLNP